MATAVLEVRGLEVLELLVYQEVMTAALEVAPQPEVVAMVEILMTFLELAEHQVMTTTKEETRGMVASVEDLREASGVLDYLGMGIKEVSLVKEEHPARAGMEMERAISVQEMEALEAVAIKVGKVVVVRVILGRTQALAEARVARVIRVDSEVHLALGVVRVTVEDLVLAAAVRMADTEVAVAGTIILVQVMGLLLVKGPAHHQHLVSRTVSLALQQVLQQPIGRVPLATHQGQARQDSGQPRQDSGQPRQGSGQPRQPQIRSTVTQMEGHLLARQR